MFYPLTYLSINISVPYKANTEKYSTEVEFVCQEGFGKVSNFDLHLIGWLLFEQEDF